MKTILTIAVLVLFLISCNKNRYDEYSCFIEAREFTQTPLIRRDLIISNDQAKLAPLVFEIIRENEEKITAEFAGMYLSFFKRTKKVKLTAPQGTNIWRCEQLN